MSVTHWHGGAPLSSELDGADRRGAKPRRRRRRRRHKILSPLRFALSFALSVFLQHALLSVKERIDADQREPLHRAVHTLERGTVLISQSRGLIHSVKVPRGSHISPLINDAKMESLLDDHCKYRTH